MEQRILTTYCLYLETQYYFFEPKARNAMKLTCVALLCGWIGDWAFTEGKIEAGYAGQQSTLGRIDNICNIKCFYRT